MKKHYNYNKESLPRPILDGRDDFINLYYQAWELAFKNVEYIEKDGWKDILTCMPGVGIMWQWDSCIMTFITNYSNGTLSALNNLDNLYMLRRKNDGFMAMAYNLDDGEPTYGERINPPLMAWAEWEHYLISGDSSRFERVLPALEGIYNFIEKNRKRESCDLYYFEDTGSSGMDNSPVSGYGAKHGDGSDTCFVDLACQQSLSALCISYICSQLGLNEKAEHYENEHVRICDNINKLHYSEKAGWYFNFFTRTWKGDRVKFINSKTAATFWTLVSGVAYGERLRSVVAHMMNENEFYTKIPFATLSKDDPNYDTAGGYWLGGVWAPTNLCAIKGLCKNGYHEYAREAAIKYLDGMCKVANDVAYGSIWECYAPDAYRPATTEYNTLSRDEFVGWSGIAPITMLIENIIGLEFDAHKNQVTFRLNNREKCGIENMIFNSNLVSIVCTEYHPFKGQTTVKVEAQKPFKLKVVTKYLWYPVEIDVPKGQSVFKI